VGWAFENYVYIPPLELQASCPNSRGTRLKHVLIIVPNDQNIRKKKVIIAVQKAIKNIILSLPCPELNPCSPSFFGNFRRSARFRG
jgi:hypothetical protein